MLLNLFSCETTQFSISFMFDLVLMVKRLFIVQVSSTTILHAYVIVPFNQTFDLTFQFRDFKICDF